MKTWVIVGASRGIGREFAQQLLNRGERVYATVRGGRSAEQTPEALFGETPGLCEVLECDVLSEESIKAFANKLASIKDLSIDYAVINAGILKYPNRATEMSYADFTLHLQTNTVGPIICAQNLLRTALPIKTIVFISSDSGSTGAFMAHEDGFAAYGASKAALNQSLRHMAAELQRKGKETVVLALHPGEVKTDMAAGASSGWEVPGQMEVDESVEKCIGTIEAKGKEGLGESGTFWTWEGKPYPW